VRQGASTPPPWQRMGDEVYGADGARVAEAVRQQDAALVVAAPLLLAALKRQVKNIERWLETGAPSGPEESKAIYEQMKAAVCAAEPASKT
jgi:hypothetical protein